MPGESFSARRQLLLTVLGKDTMEESFESMAHRKGLKVVNNDLLGGAGARPAWRLKLQRLFKRAAEPLLPPYITTALNWTSHRQADACIALTAREAHLLNYLFRVPLDRIHVVPNGVEEVFLESSPTKRGEWLVCTATIIELKQVLKLAQAAVRCSPRSVLVLLHPCFGRRILRLIRQLAFVVHAMDRFHRRGESRSRHSA